MFAPPPWRPEAQPMLVKALPAVFALAALAAAAPPAAGREARAADGLPILSGRWSAGDCAGADPAATRWFTPGATAGVDDRCRVTAERTADGFYRAHLACRYRAAQADTADVVIAVVSATSLRWVDQCSATLYRYCGRGEAPPLPGAASR